MFVHYVSYRTYSMYLFYFTLYIRGITVLCMEICSITTHHWRRDAWLCAHWLNDTIASVATSSSQHVSLNGSTAGWRQTSHWRPGAVSSNTNIYYTRLNSNQSGFYDQHYERNPRALWRTVNTKLQPPQQRSSKLSANDSANFVMIKLPSYRRRPHLPLHRILLHGRQSSFDALNQSLWQRSLS